MSTGNEIVSNRGVMSNRRMDIYVDGDAVIHFMEYNKKTERSFKTSYETIEWCCLKGKLPKDLYRRYVNG